MPLVTRTPLFSHAESSQVLWCPLVTSYKLLKVINSSSFLDSSENTNRWEDFKRNLNDKSRKCSNNECEVPQSIQRGLL